MRLNTSVFALWYLIAVVSCSGSPSQEPIDLSTPELAIAAHYKAYESADLALLKRVHSHIKWINDARLNEISKTYRNYRVVAKKIIDVEDRLNRKGDVYIGVEQQSETGAFLMHFSLRKKGGDWIILNFNADDPADYPEECQ